MKNIRWLPIPINKEVNYNIFLKIKSPLSVILCCYLNAEGDYKFIISLEIR